MTSLQVTWFFLVGALLTVYAVLDGFDLGVGFWHLFARKEEHRRTLVASVGPVWDGNEVWLLTGAAALFAAFPPVYATVFSGFYLAMMLVLVGLIFRAVALEFRSKVESDGWRSRWDLAFGLGSALPALLFGVALGNVLRGIPLAESGDYAGTFLGLLNPFSLLTGVLGFAMLATHGAHYIVLKTDGELHERARGWASLAWIAYLGLLIITLVVTVVFQPGMLENYHAAPVLWLLPLLALASVVLIGIFGRMGRAGKAFAASCASIVFLMGMAGASLFPNLVPALDAPARSLTLANSASSELTLTAMLVLTAIGLPLVIGYTIWVYRVFAGKVRPDGSHGSDDSGTTDHRPHVVIVGGGFGGLTLAKRLRRVPVRITLIDKANHHLFQPLLYQVALAALSPAEIAMPIRSILRSQKNAEVLLCEATGIDLANRRIVLADGGYLEYDYLVLAAGVETNYFGHDEWSSHALGLKDIDDAVEIRRRLLLAFEFAEREQGEEKRRELMTFVVIGGGPTGVELAGAIAELGRSVLARDFRRIDPRQCRVILVEAGDRILAGFHESLSEKAVEQLRGLGVEVRLGSPVSDVNDNGVKLGQEFIPAWTTLWAAGIQACPLAATLGVELDRMGRVIVDQDCSIPSRPEAFAIGDIACFVPGEGERPLPGISPVAIQQAQLVAGNIENDLSGRPRRPFRYHFKGIMATIGRSRAVAQTRRFRFSGLLAWLAWLLVHIWYLIGFRNRLLVMFSWFWSYVTFRNGARLVTGTCLHPSVRRKSARKVHESGRTCRE